MVPQRTRKYQTKKKTTTKEGKREYQRKYMRNVYELKKQQKKQAKEELLKKFSPSQIKIELPTVHELLWGKPKPKK